MLQFRHINAVTKILTYRVREITGRGPQLECFQLRQNGRHFPFTEPTSLATLDPAHVVRTAPDYRDSDNPDNAPNRWRPYLYLGYGGDQLQVNREGRAAANLTRFLSLSVSLDVRDMSSEFSLSRSLRSMSCSSLRPTASQMTSSEDGCLSNIYEDADSTDACPSSVYADQESICSSDIECNSESVHIDSISDQVSQPNLEELCASSPSSGSMHRQGQQNR